MRNSLTQNWATRTAAESPERSHRLRLLRHRITLKYYGMAVLIILISSLVQVANAAKVKTTEDLVTAMQKKYAKSWYKTATFVQKTVDYDKDRNQKISTWYEALSVPGSLRIDFTPIKDGNGILFTDRKIFSFKDGKQESSKAFVHPLMILGFDIYKLPLADVMDTLKALKFDLTILREDTWQGRPVYVVGAKPGDLHSWQFWIDQKNLYFVRMLGPAGKDGTQTQETQFNKYQRLGGGWMAPEVIFKLDGKIRTTEEYSEMRANPTLDVRLFDPQYWTSVHWRD